MAIGFVQGSWISATNGTASGFSSSYSVNVSTTFLVACFYGDVGSGSDNITAVTYNSASMTLGAKYNDSSDANAMRWIYLYYLTSPGTGSNTLAITSGSNKVLGVGAAEYSGVSGFDASHGVDSVNTAVTTLTGSVTTVADNCWVIGIASGGSAGPFNSTSTAGTGMTGRFNDTTNTNLLVGDSGGLVHPAGSYSMTVNPAISTVTELLLMSVTPAATGAVSHDLPRLGVGNMIGWRATLPLLGAWKLGDEIRRNDSFTRRFTKRRMK